MHGNISCKKKVMMGWVAVGFVGVMLHQWVLYFVGCVYRKYSTGRINSFEYVAIPCSLVIGVLSNIAFVMALCTHPGKVS